MTEFGDGDYEQLLQLRMRLRQFLHWSEAEAAKVGLTPAQHQLLLAIRGHDDPRGPTVGEVAAYLVRRSHTTVSLVDRAESLGLVERRGDSDDHRVVRLGLTGAGAERLSELTALHFEELARLGPRIASLLKGLDPAPPVRTGSLAGPDASEA